MVQNNHYQVKYMNYHLNLSLPVNDKIQEIYF